MEEQHISDDIFYQFQHDLLDAEELVHLLEHTAACSFCAKKLANSMETELICAPIDFKEQLMKSSRRPDIQLAVKAGETSKRMQLFLYSLKVGTATIGALIILMLAINFSNHATLQKPVDTTSDYADKSFILTTAIRDNMNQLSSNILDFSNSIMKTEVNENDQKER